MLKVELTNRKKTKWDGKLFRIVLLNASLAADMRARKHLFNLCH
jgi:hypothetical protein